MGYVAQIVPVCVLFPCRVLDRIVSFGVHYGAGRVTRHVTNTHGSASRHARPRRPPNRPNRLARRTLDRESACDLPADPRVDSPRPADALVPNLPPKC